MMRILSVLIALLMLTSSLFAQGNAEYRKKVVWGKEKTILTTDFKEVKKPSINDFIKIFHFDPIRQDTTGTCWAFSGVSFVESEIARLGYGQVKLSEMYIAYREYVEKARRFVREKGDSEFGEGSEQNAVLLRMKQYGCVPAESYSGLVNGLLKHNHEAMFQEMNDYLTFIKNNEYWDETVVLSTIRQILNKYIGEPPAEFVYKGENYTPITFMQKVVKINPDDYVDFMSTLKFPFYTLGEYEVPDNWWHCQNYYNIPLDEFYNGIKNAVRNGYTIAIGGDVSEAGKSGEDDIAIVVPWDLSQKDINQNSREYRFYNKTSTDDHGIHLVGYTSKFGHDWFLIKDSGSSAYNGDNKGYYFFRDDFIKLKMLSFMVHRDAVKGILAKMSKTK
ncbi:MAG: C1 family peptidase [Calditrichaceae bacterium]